MPEAFIKKSVHVDRLAQYAGVIACTCSLGVAGPIAAVVFACFVERSIRAEEGQHTVAVHLRQVLIKRPLMNALGEQLTDMAASVINNLAHDRGISAVGVIVLEIGGAAHVDFDLQLNAKLATVSQDCLVDRRQTSGAEVLVVTLFPGTGLCGAIEKGDFISAAHSPVASAWSLSRFEESALVAERTEFVGRYESGDAPSENDYFCAL